MQPELIESASDTAAAGPPAPDPAPPSLRLAAVSDTSAAAALKEDLMRLTAGGSRLTVLGRDVQRMTTACVQLLLAADRSLARRGGGLIARETSEAMRRAFDELGLGADLDRWVATHG